MMCVSAVFSKFRWHLIALSVFTMLTACRRPPEEWSTKQIDANIVSIQNWGVIGPFVTREDPLATAFWLEENNCEAMKSVPSIKRAIEKAARQGQFIQHRASAFLDFRQLYGQRYDPEATSAKQAVFAFVSIFTKEPTKRFLLAGYDDAAKVWLNGNLVHSDARRGGLFLYRCSTELDLKAGHNLLTIKIADQSIFWGLSAIIAKDAEQAGLELLRVQPATENFLIGKNIFSEPAEVVPAVMNAPETFAPALSISSTDQYIATEKVSPMALANWRTSRPKPGVYRATFTHKEGEYGENFCLGNPSDLFEASQQAFQKYGLTKFKDDFAAIKSRFLILMRPDNIRASDRAWQRKIVHALTECDLLVRASIANASPSGVPGVHFKQFVSDIDGSTQFYRIYIPPSAADGNPMPLIVMLPTGIAANRPFMEGAITAAHEEALALAKMSSENHVIFVWTGYRNLTSGFPIDFTHLDEVLADVDQTYHIAKGRITLTAACGGGVFSALAASRWPDRFAGIGLLTPVLLRGEIEGLPHGGAFLGGKYPRAEEAARPLLELRGMKVLVVHDGSEVGHGDPEESLWFQQEALKTGLPFELRVEGQRQGQHFGAWRDLIFWMSKQQRENPSAKRNEYYFGEVDSLAQVVSEEFAVVIGTSGTIKESEAAERLAKEFVAAWRDRQFASCRVIKDTEVTAEIEARSNLILVGNPSINTVWQRLQPSLAFKMGDRGFTIGDAKFDGPNYAIQLAVRHPTNSARRLCLVGGVSITDAKIGLWALYSCDWARGLVWNIADGTPFVERYIGQ
jgi:hypothetical protein